MASWSETGALIERCWCRGPRAQIPGQRFPGADSGAEVSEVPVTSRFLSVSVDYMILSIELIYKIRYDII